MSDEFSDILGEQPDARELAQTALALKQARPLPNPGFRGRLGRELSMRPSPASPRRLRLKILGLAAAGLLLLAVAADGVGGGGPLAPSGQAATPTASASIPR
jgi:hypothetical protein